MRDMTARAKVIGGIAVLAILVAVLCFIGLRMADDASGSKVDSATRPTFDAESSVSTTNASAVPGPSSASAVSAGVAHDAVLPLPPEAMADNPARITFLDDEGLEEGVESAGEILGHEESDIPFADDVRELYQFDYPAGCEAVALTCVLNAMGYDASSEEIVDGYLPIDPDMTDFVHQFAGDIYAFGGAYPPAIIAAGDDYLNAQAAAYQFHDGTGSSFEDVIAKVSAGYPVLIWTTGGMIDDPWFTDQEEDGYRWYENEHCVVLCGIDGDDVLVMDPGAGFVTMDASYFGALYEECGSMCAYPESAN